MDIKNGQDWLCQVVREAIGKEKVAVKAKNNNSHFELPSAIFENWFSQTKDNEFACKIHIDEIGKFSALVHVNDNAQKRIATEILKTILSHSALI